MPVAMTIFLNESVKDRLDKAATAMGVSAEVMAADLLQDSVEPVEMTDWQLAEVLAAEQEAERIGWVDGDEVQRWVASWGTENELPRPMPSLPQVSIG